MQTQNRLSEPRRKRGQQPVAPHPNPILAALGCSETIEDRFWEKVLILPYDRGCWIWIGAFDHDGYGHISPSTANDTKLRAHRLSWILHFGSIPNGLCVCHHCDNRKCIRWDHLFLGSYADNTRDMWAKGRGNTEHVKPPPPMRGAKNPMAKLTQDKVDQIRRLYPQRSATELGDQFGVSTDNIYHILRHKTWLRCS